MTAGPPGRCSTGHWIPARFRCVSLIRWSAIAAIGLASLLGARGAAADGPPVVPNPVKVTIPALGVSANVQDVGLADDGSMGVPVGFDDVAWYDLGVQPGYAGWAAFTGHISSTAAPGVFYNIDGLSAGNTIHIIGDDGTELVFVVQEVDIYKADNVPLDKIFAPTTAAGVVLITCGGDWDFAAHLFANRTIVYATLASG
jgi:sortase A